MLGCLRQSHFRCSRTDVLQVALSCGFWGTWHTTPRSGVRCGCISDFLDPMGLVCSGLAVSLHTISDSGNAFLLSVGASRSV
jgi:hypothetical protein